MPTITTLDEFNNLNDSNKEQLNEFLNDKFILYHITFEVRGNDHRWIITGRSNQLCIKEDNTNLLSLEQLEDFFDYVIKENKNRQISFIKDQICITNITRLKVTAYSYFKYINNPKLSYYDYPE